MDLTLAWLIRCGERPCPIGRRPVPLTWLSRPSSSVVGGSFRRSMSAVGTAIAGGSPSAAMLEEGMCPDNRMLARGFPVRPNRGSPGLCRDLEKIMCGLWDPIVGPVGCLCHGRDDCIGIGRCRRGWGQTASSECSDVRSATMEDLLAGARRGGPGARCGEMGDCRYDLRRVDWRTRFPVRAADPSSSDLVQNRLIEGGGCVWCRRTGVPSAPGARERAESLCEIRSFRRSRGVGRDGR